jgi:two-component system sensor histidine kinase HydH
MSHQIDDVMDFVHVKPLVLAKASLWEMIETALETTPIPDSVKIIMPKNDQQLLCDERRLQNVFSNILSNAIQAIGNKDGTITFTVSNSEDRILINIHDTGLGISKDVLPRIFDPLFTTKSQGTGLGLLSCKNIIEMHGGIISVSSEHGKGTTFTISLPTDHTFL